MVIEQKGLCPAEPVDGVGAPDRGGGGEDDDEAPRWAGDRQGRSLTEDFSEYILYTFLYK